VREFGRLGGYLRVFSYREVLCKSMEVQGVSEVSPKNFNTDVIHT
jgi:hypothetical protein